MTFQEWLDKWNIRAGMDTRHGPKYSSRTGRVENGWVPLLDELVNDLVELGWNRELAQVKSKFGTLRFYVADASPEIRKRIEAAEIQSSLTCESCGRPAVLRKKKSNWLVTACKDCLPEDQASDFEWTIGPIWQSGTAFPKQGDSSSE